MTSSLTIAVDVGNTLVKFGAFAPTAALDSPVSTLELETHNLALDELSDWSAIVNGDEAEQWILCSVHAAACTQLMTWLSRRDTASVKLLHHADFTLPTQLENPHQVGLDRLANATAVAELKQPAQAAIIIDAGTAITVDVLSADNVFLGGAILPGLRMAAHALADYTDRLPLVFIDVTTTPPAIGNNTASAIQSGLLWGVVGAITEIANRQQLQMGEELEFYLTGGDATTLAQYLHHEVRVIPHLALAGIAAAG